MKQFCEITVLGYVSSEVESGKGKVDLATFLLITNLDYKQQKGTKKFYKLYFKIVTTGTLAEHIKNIAKVGDQVFAVGELKVNLWKGKTTNEIWTREIRILKEKPDEDSEVPINLSNIGTPVLELELKNRNRSIIPGVKSKHAERLESGYYGSEGNDEGVTTGDDLYGGEF